MSEGITGNPAKKEYAHVAGGELIPIPNQGAIFGGSSSAP